MQLKPGEQLCSPVSEAEVIVIKAPAADVVLTCAGQPMTPKGAGPAQAAGTGGAEGTGGAAGAAGSTDTTPGEGAVLGKRYVDTELDLEVLCTKAGPGALAVDGRLLTLKSPKPLPSSD